MYITWAIIEVLIYKFDYELITYSISVTWNYHTLASKLDKLFNFVVVANFGVVAHLSVDHFYCHDVKLTGLVGKMTPLAYLDRSSG
jgi:hypothetical protein